ncbi:hypothetical protein [Bdellovibrio sp. HCB-110]|uniref:hypothetical protein n=1 Tax=Bdellovibrio sp. HCB-110 TaxID=3391182 RepID=UPI0039B6A949
MIRRFAFATILVSLLGFQAQAHTTFTGFWRGTCQDSRGLTRQASLSIVQNGCHSIQINNRFFPFGQLVSSPTNLPGWSGHADEIIHFVNGGTELQYFYSAVLAAPGQIPTKVNTSTTFKRMENMMTSESYTVESNLREFCQYTL